MRDVPIRGFGIYKLAAAPAQQGQRRGLFGDIRSGLNSAGTLHKYKNRIASGSMSDGEWNTVLSAAKDLGNNKLAKDVGGFFTRGKYGENYFNGMHQALTQVRDFQNMGMLRKAWTAVVGLNHNQRAGVNWLQKYHPESLKGTPFEVR